MKHPFLIVFSMVVLTGILTGGCTPTTATRGNIPEQDRLSQIEVGTSGQDDVFRALGSPTTVSPFHENIWYYIGQKTEKHGVFDPEIVNERIVAVTFDDQGIVQDMETMENARLDVPIKDSKTPTYGNEVTAIQQLLGNLGKFNPRPREESR